MHNEMDNIKEDVLGVIRSGSVAMRPKWHFVLKGALLITGILIALVAIITLASFALFSMRETGALTAPLFGMRGILPFLRAIPAALVTLSIIFLILLETLVRRYSFAYRAPLLYSLTAIIAVITAASFAAAPFHRAPFRAARHGKLRIGGQLYRQFRVGHARNVRHGIIESLVVGGFVLRDIEDATSLVRISPETHIPAGMTFNMGDTITVFGIENTEAVEARGVRVDGF